MSWIEVGHWLAGEAEDLGYPASWVVEKRSPQFPDAALADIAAVVAEPPVRASAMDVAPDFVVGAVSRPQNVAAFCFQAASYAQVSLWIAWANGGIAAHDLIRLWHWAVSSGRVADFKWNMPVETSALLAPAWKEARLSRSRAIGGDDHVGFRDRNRERRLSDCCEMLGRLRGRRQPPSPSPLVVVDNLTVITGNKIHVAGLVPGYRDAGPNWRIVDASMSAQPDRALDRFRELTAGLHKRHAARDNGTAGHSDEPDRSLRAMNRTEESDRGRVVMKVAGLAAAREVCAVIREAIDSAKDFGGTSFAEQAFGNPESLGDAVRQQVVAAGLDATEFDIIARAVLAARFPAVAVALQDPFTGWLAAIETADVGRKVLVLATAAQPLYDYCRARRDQADATVVAAGLDRALARLIDEIEQLPVDAQAAGGDLPEGEGPGRDCQGLAETFDELAELETASAQLDERLLRAHVFVRLQIDLPTPDVIDRAVRIAVAGHQGVRQLVARNLRSDALNEVAAIAVTDALHQRIEAGPDLLGRFFVLPGSTTAHGFEPKAGAAADDSNAGTPPAPVSLFRSFWREHGVQTTVAAPH